MTDWDRIIREAERLAQQFRQRKVNLGEAQKAGDYFRYRDYDETVMAGYLQTLAEDPPPRSKRTQGYYVGIRAIWTDWKTDLSGEDKARAWGWALRLARTWR